VRVRKAWLTAFQAAGVQLHALASAPARLWHGSDSDSSPARSLLDSPEGREDIVRACEAALGRTVDGGEPSWPRHVDDHYRPNLVQYLILHRKENKSRNKYAQLAASFFHHACHSMHAHDS